MFAFSSWAVHEHFGNMSQYEGSSVHGDQQGSVLSGEREPLVQSLPCPVSDSHQSSLNAGGRKDTAWNSTEQQDPDDVKCKLRLHY